jgi:putative spermidine/putrescine transport system permease protein
LFSALRDQIDPTIAANSTLMIVVTTLGLLLAQCYGRRRDA